jgi:hypothetical protein
VLPDDILTESIPGNIRKAEHFVAFLRRFIEYLKTRMRVMHVVAETPLSFLQHVKEVTYIERKPLRYFFSYLNPVSAQKDWLHWFVLWKSPIYQSLDNYQKSQHLQH